MGLFVYRNTSDNNKESNCRITGQTGCAEPRSACSEGWLYHSWIDFVSAAVLSSVAFCFQPNTIWPSYIDACFCPLQPAIVLAPINCTQSAAPQTDVPMTTKSEPQLTEAADRSEDSPQQPAPQEPLPAEKDEEENKRDWRDSTTFHIPLFFPKLYHTWT